MRMNQPTISIISFFIFMNNASFASALDPVLYYKTLSAGLENSAYATINGRVTDEAGNPISGVNVFVQGSKTGTFTDTDGRFSLEAKTGDVISCSSIGYETATAVINGPVVSIVLRINFSPLSQVVVSGNMVEIQKKADISSVTVLTEKDIQAMPGQTLDRLFTGVVPGVSVPSLGTQEGLTNTPLEIRGAGNAYGGYYSGREAVKLYVDGVEFAAGVNYMAMLNKDDIERIEVVRGPSAAALYGSGANGGVILVFTKKAQKEKTSIDITTSAGFHKSDWVKNPFQQKHAIAISHEHRGLMYTLGGNYRTQQDYLPNGFLKTAGGYANIAYTTGKFKLQLNTSLNTARMIMNAKPVYDDLPDPYDYFILERSSAYMKRHTQVNTGTVSLSITYKPKRWWTQTLVMGYTSNTTPLHTDTAVATNKDLVKLYTDYRGGLFYVLYTFKDFVWNYRYVNTFSIHKTGDPFSMNIIAGLESSKYFSQLSGQYYLIKYTTARGFSSQAYSYPSTDPYNYFSIQNTGGFLQISPAIKGKYFLVAGVRYNESNVASYAAAPKLGLTALFNTGGLIFKPRVNFGAGITPPPYAATHPRKSTSPNVTYIPNPDIKQQEQKGYELGLELYNKKGNLKAEIACYDNIVTNGFLYTQTVNPIPGYPRHLDIKWINNGKFANKGWEFSASYGLGHFNISGNYSIIRSVYVDTFDYNGRIFRKGDLVPLSPGYTGGLILNYESPKLFGKADNFSATISLVAFGKMYAQDNYAYNVESSKIDPNGVDPYPDQNDFYRITRPINKLNFALSYRFLPLLTGFIQAENFTNNTRPDYDRSTPVAGASWMFGLRMNYTKTNH